MTPFDYVSSINSGKNLLDGVDNIDVVFKDYNSFLTNRALSYHNDTIMFANEMNKYSNLDKDEQYSFFINIVRPKKRFSKWAKPEKNNDLDVIVEYFGYSYEKAKQIIDLISYDDQKKIKIKIRKGGSK